MALKNALGNISLEATQQDIKALETQIAGLTSEIKTLTETMLYFVTSMLEKMPRVDAADRLIVTHAESNPAVTIATNQDIRNITGTLAGLTQIGGRDAGNATYAINNSGALHIYDNVRCT